MIAKHFHPTAYSPAEDVMDKEDLILDRAQALDRVGGDHVLLQEVAHLFLREIPQQLLAIHDAIIVNDVVALARTAHWLRGSAGNLGATRIAQKAFDLEHAGLKLDWARAVRALAELKKEVDLLKHEILTLRHLATSA